MIAMNLKDMYPYSRVVMKAAAAKTKHMDK